MKIFVSESLRNIYRVLHVTWTVLYILIVPIYSLDNCKIEVERQWYDFSGLAIKSWMVSGLSLTSSYGLASATVSLCNNPHDSPCGNVSFCVVDKNGSKWSSANSTLNVKEDKNITISFTLRKISDSSKVINAEIELQCSKEIGQPKLQEFKDNQLFLLWETAAACKIKYPNIYKNCILKDEYMGVINLQPLHHMQYYKVSNNQTSYFLNLCGGTVDSICPSEDGSVAVCEIDSANRSHILGLAPKQIIVEDDFLVEFRNKRKKTVAKIELICNPRVLLAELKFKSLVGETRIFELETPLVCAKELKHCTVRDKDQYKYDLSSISGKDYKINDNQGNTYFISVCRSVNDSRCPGGASVCLHNGTTFISLGALRRGPEVIEDDQLQISSSGGSYCKSTLRSRSVIKFQCSKTESHMTLQNISSDCVYTFELYTTAACPFMAAVGSDCRVQDPVYGYDFQLKALHSEDKDYILDGPEDQKFRLNVCGNLVEPCNGSRNASVCLIDHKGAQHIIGGIADSPHYYNGRLSFELNGDICKSTGVFYKVIIILACVHKLNEESYPSFLEKGDDCTYIFAWPTKVACLEFTVRNCNVTDENAVVYDLSPLSRYETDYIAWDNETRVEKKFIINICQSILFGHDSMCPPLTGVCMRDLTKPNYLKSFSSLGLASSLQYDKVKKMLKVEYVKGDMCYQKEVNGDKRSVISFICDENATEPHVKFVQENNCVYEFVMKTKLACSIQRIQERNHCQAYDSVTEKRVNLSLLAGREFSINDTLGRHYRFVVCGSLKNVSILGVGVCRETVAGCENLGMGNSNLHFKAGKLFLNYTDGINCSKNARTYTEIEFICDIENKGLHLVSAHLCAYSFVFYTSLACVVPCKTDGPKEISLSLLSSYEKNYKTPVNGVDYFINICKPLVPEKGLNCYNGSAICRAVPRTGNEWTNIVSLGFPHSRPALHGDKIVLNYTSNFRCPDKDSFNLSSSVVFMCDLMVGIGSPVFNELLNECHYEFIWKSSVVCENYMIQLGEALASRVLSNNQTNTIINLQPLCNNKTYKVGDYFISVCDSLFLCEVMKVDIHKNISYGKADNVLFNYSENMTQLFLSRGDECKAKSTENYHATINLLCGMRPDQLPYVSRETDCSVEFVWKSSAACAQRVPVATVTTSTNTTGKSSTSIGAVVGGIVLVIIACITLYCLKNPLRRVCDGNCTNRFLGSRHQGEFHYTLRNPDSFDFEASSEELL